MSTVLRIDNLRIETDGDTPRTLVDGVSLRVDRGESLGVVGESGSGKSLTVLAALGLLPVGTRVTGGRIVLDDRVLVDVEADVWAGERELRALRGRTAAMVFQDPMSSLDPLRAVGAQVASAVRVHAPRLGRRAARERAIDLLTSVGVRDAADRAGTRPHQWSGGMRQRAMIAMAIAHDPLLLIADEPTTALDVTVQAQVMDLLAEVRERTGSTLVLITHPLENLNHIVLGSNDSGWAGLVLFLLALVIGGVLWALASPISTKYPQKVQKIGAKMLGPINKWF